MSLSACPCPESALETNQQSFASTCSSSVGGLSAIFLDTDAAAQQGSLRAAQGAIRKGAAFVCGPRVLANPLHRRNLSQLRVFRFRIPLPHDLYMFSDYLEKLAVYQKRQWTCAVTGKADLTYEEAVESERKSKEYISRLAYPVQKRVLELAQFSTVSRMEHLVDEIVNELKDKYLVDEQVQLVNTGRDRNHPQVVIEQVLPDNQYRIVDIQTGDTQTVSASALGRTRNAISKQLVRAFLKEAIGRQSYVGAPWIVKDEYVSEFDINTTPPTELWDSKEKRLKRQVIFWFIC